ncbi:hypothetical protein [Streptomyces sp. WM6386]|uniref:hypothetical protein n=1 Tax=Streptomyces sp. WM6386 TaxID=1415558 RepID=UPI000619B4A5|nr:hypothetical protein [Streptomyces sp. WM6386]KKD04234.1 hypothetical protein TN53_30890 [Streptomyces sp. WM6386]
MPAEAPTAPTKVTASATNTSVVVSWDAATDNEGVAKYQVTRTGGTKGTCRHRARATSGCTPVATRTDVLARQEAP